jgi:hypothetical protein
VGGHTHTSDIRIFYTTYSRMLERADDDRDDRVEVDRSHIPTLHRAQMFEVTLALAEDGYQI